MSTLDRLKPEAKRLLSEAFVSGEQTTLEPSSYEELTEPIGRDVDLTPLDEAAESIVEETTRHDAGIDKYAAPVVHRTLPLTHREAAVPGVWRYLTVVQYPEFVRHRWEDCSGGKHFWSLTTRPDGNAFARLWWIAELTVQNGNYERTQKALSSQSLANAIFKVNLSHYRPAAWAFVDVLDEVEVSPGDVIKPLRSKLSTIPVEQLTYDDIAALIRRVAERFVESPEKNQETLA